MSFEALWRELLPIGRAAAGGYRRFSWTAADLECRAWFMEAARARGLAVEPDRNGNLFAWWRPRGAEGAGIVTGSHLDSVPDGGAFDGPLGVVSALAAVDLLRSRGARPVRPIGVAAFTEEEGARFGIACLGSRLLTGAIDPARARALRDAAGMTLGEAMTTQGYDPEGLGRDDDLLGRIGGFVELHVEQGRALETPVGVASAIWPHGRWRLDFAGEGNHAGTTRLGDRRDPMLPFAGAVLAARAAAERHGSLATVGKVVVTPGGVNAIPSRVLAWLDARGPSDESVAATVEQVRAAAAGSADEHGVAVTLTPESYTSVVGFAHPLRDRVSAAVRTAGLPAPPVLPTGAGHDAGLLAAHVPTAMLFVRNPTGVSHAPREHAETADCLAGVEALAAVLEDLAC